MMTFLTMAIEHFLQRYLRLDPQSQDRLRQLDGKIIKLELVDWELAFYLFPGPQGLALQNYYEGEVDTTIAAPPLTLLRAVASNPAETILLGKELRITGDVGLAQKLVQVFQQFEIEWEELLSQAVGDTLAHEMGKIFRMTRQKGQETIDNLTTQVTEYLQKEAQLFPSPEEVEDFFADIQTLQNDVERISLNIISSPLVGEGGCRPDEG